MSAAASSRARALEKLAARGSLFTIVGHVGGEALRFASNLLLTRLLYPEAFGLMAIANAVLQGARMLSDVGIRGSIVQHSRGEEPAFVNTAWTIQVARGFAICALLLLCAGPLATAYDKPDAAQWIRVLAFAAAIDGFTSTAGFALVRLVRPGRQVARDLGARAVGVAVTVTWALASPSIWALASGALVTSVAQVVLSHRMLPGYRNRFAYEAEAVRAISSFGRWVIVASLMTYLLNQGDRLILGKASSSAELGVYAIAAWMAFAVAEGVQKISLNVLFPVYARIRELDLRAQRREVARYRLGILALAVPALWAIALSGDLIVSLLYDARYADAGWMLQLLAIGMIPVAVSYSAERVLLADGDSFAHVVLQTAQAGLLLGSMLAGLAIGPGGARGVILGTIAGRLLGYLPLAWSIHRKGLWLPQLDALTFGASAVVLAAGFGWRGWP